jgi:hypothetical protein
VKGRIEASVVFEVLRGCHWNPLGSKLCRRASAYHLVGFLHRGGIVNSTQQRQ